MPRAEGDDGVYRLPGLYASLLEYERANVDPRLYYGINDPLERLWASLGRPRRGCIRSWSSVSKLVSR